MKLNKIDETTLKNNNLVKNVKRHTEEATGFMGNVIFNFNFQF